MVAVDSGVEPSVTMQDWSRRYRRTAVVTKGAGGVAVSSPSEYFEIEATAIEPIDTVGAGRGRTRPRWVSATTRGDRSHAMLLERRECPAGLLPRKDALDDGNAYGCCDSNYKIAILKAVLNYQALKKPIDQTVLAGLAGSRVG